MPIVNWVIDSISEGEERHYEGNLRIDCSIPPRAKIYVKNGNLTVNGDVGENAFIKLEAQSIPTGMQSTSHNGSRTTVFGGVSANAISGSNIFINGVHLPGRTTVFGGVSANVISGSNISINGANLSVGTAPMMFSTVSSSFASLPSHEIIINGDIKEGAKINADSAISCRNIAKDCFIQSSGDVNCGDVGDEAMILADNANIYAANIHDSAMLRTKNGSIHAKNVSPKAKLKTHNGPIAVQNVEEDAELNTAMGSISAWDVANNAVLSTRNGDITARNVSGSATLTTNNGAIRVDSANDPSKLSTSNGEVYIGGRPHQQSERSHGTRHGRVPTFDFR